MGLALIFSVISMLVQGCVSVPSQNVFQQTAQKLIGKSQAELVLCAGNPLQQEPHGQDTVFRYYKEASMLEESRPFLKGSRPRVHHGCWVNILIENKRITGVEFRTVPEEVKVHANECEELFQACSP